MILDDDIKRIMYEQNVGPVTARRVALASRRMRVKIKKKLREKNAK